MNNQVKKIEEIKKKYSQCAILITDQYNRRYLSGFTGSAGKLLLANEANYLLTDFRYIEQATAQAPNFTCIDIGTEGYIKTMNNLLTQHEVTSLAFEDESISYMEYEKIKEEGKQKELVPLHSDIIDLRVVKTSEELQKIQQAEAIGDQAFSYILSQIKEGMTELEIALLLEVAMKKAGATDVSFSTIVASGVHSSMPHWKPDHTKVKKGDMITMDFGCIFEGYCSDMTRTIVLGKANEEQKKVYNLVKQAQEAALSYISAGKTGYEVDKIARDMIYQGGYEGYFGHGLGHSVGLYIHEEPRLSPSCNKVLKENTTMTVEPGIYLPGKFGVRIEDLVVIKENGYENLTHSSKELIEL